jgi:hypothetical protein
VFWFGPAARSAVAGASWWSSGFSCSRALTTPSHWPQRGQLTGAQSPEPIARTWWRAAYRRRIGRFYEVQAIRSDESERASNFPTAAAMSRYM